jgi:aminomethyltransferase
MEDDSTAPTAEVRAPTAPELILSPLHPAQLGAGVKFSEFAGWQMPLEFSGVVSEHMAVREAVGVFDVSHLGTTLVRGAGAVADLNRLLTNDLDRIGPGRAQYSLLCDGEGQVVDDLIVYIFSADDVLLIPNAGNASAVNEVVRAGVGPGVEVIDRQRDTAIIAVQGPFAADLLGLVGLPAGMTYLGVERSTFEGVEVVVCRTGYTGELGFEILLSGESAVGLWDRLLTAGAALGVRPCGLGARDTLRTEMGSPLHGQDLGGEIGPVEAGLSWAVGWDKPKFRGREALLAARHDPLRPRVRALLMLDRGVPRAGASVHLRPDGPEVGRLTSGTFSPVLRVGIALALLAPEIVPGDEVLVNLRGRWLAARVAPAPLVEASPRD